MKRSLQNLLESFGVYIKRYHNCPGVDWGLDVARALRRRPCATLFDVGANTGQTADYLARRFPGTTIHAFEPVRATFDELVKSVRDPRRVQCHALALSDTTETKRIAIMGSSVLSSLESAAVPAGTDTKYEDVRTDTVDNFCRAHNITQIDVLKTDTEGHDLKVLAGAEGMLKAQAIRAVYTEVTFSKDNRRNTLFYPVSDFLTGRGFRFMGLYEINYFQSLPQDQAFCNALFVLANEIE